MTYEDRIRQAIENEKKLGGKWSLENAHVVFPITAALVSSLRTSKLQNLILK
jgi:hypothetical protein